MRKSRHQQQRRARACTLRARAATRRHPMEAELVQLHRQALQPGAPSPVGRLRSLLSTESSVLPALAAAAGGGTLKELLRALCWALKELTASLDVSMEARAGDRLRASGRGAARLRYGPAHSSPPPHARLPPQQAHTAQLLVRSLARTMELLEAGSIDERRAEEATASRAASAPSPCSSAPPTLSLS